MRIYCTIIICTLLCSCHSFDLDQETHNIMSIHNAQRDHHFNGNSAAFVSIMASDFIAVNRGEIDHPSVEENLTGFYAYFNSVKFLKWDDLSQPVIRFSEDGSLAYTIVSKEVEIKYQLANGDSLIEKTDFAWTSIYRNSDDGWKIETVTSTNKPVEYPPGKEQRLELSLAAFDQAFREADTTKLSQLITRDYLHTNSNGPPINGDAWLQYVATRREAIDSGTLTITDYRSLDRIITYLEKSAIVSARVEVDQLSDGRRQQNSYQVTQVWTDERGIWKRAAFHDGIR